MNRIYLIILLLLTSLTKAQTCSDFPEITASSTNLCAGLSATLSINYTPPTICNMNITPSTIPLGNPIPGFTYGGMFNGHYYYVYNTPTAWTQGELICRQNGGYLVCINDINENAFVSNLTNNNIWIGMFRDPVTCNFRWLDCMNITFTNWRPGEPNSGPCGEPYVQIIRGCSFGLNTWNNLGDNSSNGSCYSNMVPIMEIDPAIYNTPITSATTYLWSTGETTSSINVSPTTTTNYWVDITSGTLTCRKNITINVGPSISPTANPTQIFCGSATIADLSATGTNIQWYASSTGGTPLAPTTSLVNGGSYYSTQTINGCESQIRTVVNVTILPQTVPPSGNSTQSFCNSALVSDLVVAGTNIQWYTNPVGGTPLSSNTALINGTTYYASQTVNGCESSIRLAVNVNINASQITASASIVCTGEAVNLSVNGYIQPVQYSATKNFTAPWQIDWPVSIGANYILKVSGTYGITSNGGIDADAAFALINQTPYNQSCTGYQDRWLLVDNCPARPNPDIYNPNHIYYYYINNSDGIVNITYSDGQYSDNSGTLIFELYNSIVTFLWSTGETTSSINPILNTTTIFWCDITINGNTCRKYVTINVNSSTLAPTAPTPQTFCNSATVADLIATGNNIKWYSIATGGTPLSNTTALVNGTTYYASQTINGCESLTRLPVNVIINTPASPTGNSNQLFCNSATVANLLMNGQNIQWYTTTTGGTPLTSMIVLTNATTYYASQTINGCESLVRTPVIVTIDAVSIPVGGAIQEFCRIDTPRVSDLTPNQSNIKWYTVPVGGNPLNQNTLLLDGATYYAESTNLTTGCKSPTRLVVLVKINDSNPPAGEINQVFCAEDNPTLSYVIMNAENSLVWYDSNTGGNILPLTTFLEDNQSYYASNLDNITGCYSSERTKVDMTLLQCELEINNILTLNGNNLNDFIFIKNIDNFPKSEFQIFNRYGKLVWRGYNYNNLQNTFTGKANVQGVYKPDEYLPTGTYFYVLTYFDRYRNENKEVKGFLQINNNQ